jgi:hypothetical protein
MVRYRYLFALLCQHDAVAACVGVRRSTLVLAGMHCGMLSDVGSLMQWHMPCCSLLLAACKGLYEARLI